MLHFRRGLVRGGAALAALIMTISPEHASAQSSGGTIQPDTNIQKDGGELEEITVTARRRAEPLQDTPIAVSALTGDELDAKLVSNISQVASSVPNLTFDVSEGIGGSQAASQVFIRGIGQTDFQPGTEPGVGIYLDGVYIARSVGSAFDLLDVERIEVLRGPQGTLFGRNSIGGAIQVISKKPAAVAGGDITITAGSDSRFDVRASVDAPLSNSLLTKASILSRKRDGYVHNLQSGQDLGDDDTKAARFAARWLPSNTLTVDFSVDYTRERDDGAAAVGVVYNDAPPTIAFFYNTVGQNGIPGFIAVPPGRDIFGNNLPFPQSPNCPGGSPTPLTNPNCFNAQYNTGNLSSTFGNRTESNLDLVGAALDLQYQASDRLGVRSIAAYRTVDADFTTDIDRSPLPVGEVETRQSFDQYSEELQLNLQFNDLVGTVGLYLFHESGFDVSLVRTGAGTFNADGAIDNDSIAVFGQLTYSLTERLKLTGGVRYTNEDKRFTPNNVEVTNFFLPPGLFTLLPPVLPPGFRLLPSEEVKISVNEVTTLANVSYKVTDDVLAYLTYSNGYKSGGFNQRNIFPAAAVVSFQPEFVDVYEAGLKSEWFNHRVRFNLAAFFTDYSDVQINVQKGFVPTVTNAGAAEIKGLEAELTARPTEDFELSASFGYIDAKYTRIDDPTANVRLDSRFVNTPKHSFSAGASYTFDLKGRGSIIPRADWSYRSVVFNDAENNPQFRQPGLELVDTSLSYRDAADKWQITAAISNLTDEKYITGGFINGVGGFGQALVARDRTWSLSLRRRF